MNNFPAYCNSTSMGILPHVDEKKALNLALSLDIPFWPQLPLKDFRDDMWAQFSRDFPGIIVDFENKKVRLNKTKFYEELNDYSLKMDDISSFEIKEEHSTTFYKFLEMDLSTYPAIRGQVTGPLNLGFRILDEENKPIIYHDDIRELLFDFVKKKILWQYNKLKEKNKNAFIWIDEPGIAWTFSSFSGYNDIQAKNDLTDLYSDFPRPRGLHLCINVDMDYLTDFDIDILSFEAYQMEILTKSAACSLGKFLGKGKIISWGIVPTVSVFLDKETPDTLTEKVIHYMKQIEMYGGVSSEQVARQSLVAPARCCLKNADLTDLKKNPHHRIEEIEQGIEEELVEKAIEYTIEISRKLKKRFGFL